MGAKKEGKKKKKGVKPGRNCFCLFCISEDFPSKQELIEKQIDKEITKEYLFDE